MYPGNTTRHVLYLDQKFAGSSPQIDAINCIPREYMGMEYRDGNTLKKSMHKKNRKNIFLNFFDNLTNFPTCLVFLHSPSPLKQINSQWVVEVHS